MAAAPGAVALPSTWRGFGNVPPRLPPDRRKAWNAVRPPRRLGDRCRPSVTCRAQGGRRIPSRLCPLPRATPKIAVCPISRRTGTCRGACAREAGPRPLGRPEEESFRAGLPLHRGHVPADLRPAAIWGGECEGGGRQGQWLNGASCQSRGPGKDSQDSFRCLGSGLGRARSGRSRRFRVSSALGKRLTCKIVSTVFLLELSLAPYISTSSTLSRVPRICEGVQRVRCLHRPFFLAGRWLESLAPEVGLSCPPSDAQERPPGLPALPSVVIFQQPKPTRKMRTGTDRRALRRSAHTHLSIERSTFAVRLLRRRKIEDAVDAGAEVLFQQAFILFTARREGAGWMPRLPRPARWPQPSGLAVPRVVAVRGGEGMRGGNLLPPLCC